MIIYLFSEVQQIINLYNIYSMMFLIKIFLKFQMNNTLQHNNHIIKTRE